MLKRLQLVLWATPRHVILFFFFSKLLLLFFLKKKMRILAPDFPSFQKIMRERRCVSNPSREFETVARDKRAIRREVSGSWLEDLSKSQQINLRILCTNKALPKDGGDSSGREQQGRSHNIKIGTPHIGECQQGRLRWLRDRQRYRTAQRRRRRQQQQ
jgi:hypothetical protein